MEPKFDVWVAFVPGVEFGDGQAELIECRGVRAQGLTRSRYSSRCPRHPRSTVTGRASCDNTTTNSSRHREWAYPFCNFIPQILPLRASERGEAPIVYGQQIPFGQLAQPSAVGAIPPSDGEIVEEARGPEARCCIPEAAAPLGEGRGQPRLADPDRADEDQVVVLLDPGASSSQSSRRSPSTRLNSLVLCVTKVKS